MGSLLKNNPRTFSEVEEVLRPLSERTGKGKFTLDLTKQLAEAAGNPQDTLRVVHIAGTSGKTTTSYYMAALLYGAGQKVGLTVSPHIVSIAERVQIGGAPLSESKFVKYFNEYFALVAASGLEPSYFEFMMVFALWVFAQEKVDYAVVETGLGGLLDSSNICRRSDKLCIITDIGYDHMHVLGHTLHEIAAQKAGIIALGNTVVMYEQAPEIMASVHETVTHEVAKLILVPQEQMNTYFERNFNLAYHAYQVLATRDHLPVLSSNDKGTIFKSVHVPGRLEKIVVGSTTFILDGAHNEQKLSALFSTLDALYGVKKWPILLALKADKDAPKISQIITEHATEIVVSEFQGIQDTPVTATPANVLAEFFDKAQVIVPLELALQYFLDQGSKEVLVTGSFFAVAEARAWLITHKHGIVEE